MNILRSSCHKLALVVCLTLGSSPQSARAWSPVDPALQAPTHRHNPEPMLARLAAKFQLYLWLSSHLQDADGFIEWKKCDSLLFTSLYGAWAPTGSVTIEAARDRLGAWHRRSLQQAPCYPEQSGSTISRDMILGLLWFIWEKRRLDLAEDLFRYGQKHNWRMGQGDLSRTLLSPALRATLAEIIQRLGGPNHRYHRRMPQLYRHNIGYAAHLDLLSILLRARILGHMGASAYRIIEHQYRRVPVNPLFAYAYHRYGDGDQTTTLAALLDERLFPADRLPTQHDRCSPWINERDPGTDWEPCRLHEPAEAFSGGDFIFVAGLLLDD